MEKRLADWDSRISLRGVRFSADPSILGARRGTPVEVHLGADKRLSIHHEGRLVGENVLARGGSPPQDDPAHARAIRKLREEPTARVWGHPHPSSNENSHNRTES